MKVFAALALIAAATVVSAETNAQRLARGVAPNAPGKRATPVAAARRGYPSGSPGGGQCNTGPVNCCNSVGQAGSDNLVDDLVKLVGAVVEVGTHVGVTCSAVVGTTGCHQQPVCCEDNSYNGIINVGCSPINIGL